MVMGFKVPVKLRWWRAIQGLTKATQSIHTNSKTQSN